MTIRNKKQLETYKEAARIANKITQLLHEMVAVGVTPLDLDARADKLCKQYGVIPNFKGVGSPGNLYQHATCIAVNDAVLHVIPNSIPFKKGDIVKIDFGLKYKGLNTDHCITVVVKKFNNETDKKLLTVARDSVQSAAQLAIAGNRVGDLGYTMQSMAEAAGFNVVREYVGHGIGKTLHDDPQIPAYGKKNSGQFLKNGTVICVESQITIGSSDLHEEKDGWALKTKDGKNAAMFEYMVVVGKQKPIFLTQTMDLPLVAG